MDAVRRTTRVPFSKAEKVFHRQDEKRRDEDEKRAGDPDLHTALVRFVRLVPGLTVRCDFGHHATSK
jgi:hypothetical protein